MSAGPVFSEYAGYYDLIYKDKDYTAETEYVHELIQRHRPGTCMLLELGAGTGKHAKLQADKGYRIHGVERSGEMLAQAQRLAAERSQENVQWLVPTFSLGDIRTARVDEKYDATSHYFM